MIISLNWIRDFIEIPADLDPRALALRFTTTTAEVDGVEHHRANFARLAAARIDEIERVAGEDKLRRIHLTADRRYVTLSTAPDLLPGATVVYAPPGATVAGHALERTDTAGRPSDGMIVAGQALELMQVGANALFLPPNTPPGLPIDSAPFDDWLIEIDNKSITHRPDLWGHYGIAREIAAILGLPLRPYDVTDPDDLRSNLPAIPIEIDDAVKCPRYTGLLMKGLRPQPAPLWMQARLALVGMRPINLLVDLTNYVMAELGQPMHAFDGAKLTDIQVADAAPGERFTTLDGVTRTMPRGTLMIQCGRRSVAIAGIMGGAETEVSDRTETVLLESANFDAATIRRAATAMGHRTEASARFEKSLDPAYTVLGIARFHRLATAELPDLKLASTLSDCHPAPKSPRPIDLDCAFAARFIGKDVSQAEIVRSLTALDFRCAPNGDVLRVTPPSYRATKDIEIEADLIEEVARFIGYDHIEPVLPRVAARHLDESPAARIEERTLDYLCVGNEFAEVHDYIWYDDAWLARLGFDPGPCVRLRNPAAENCSRFRGLLSPGLLATVERNRHHAARFALAEIGSVFRTGTAEVEQAQERRLGLAVAQAGGRSDAAGWDRLRSALTGWARQVLEARVEFVPTNARYPWEDEHRVASVAIAGREVGRVTIVPLACKQRIDDRLKAWSIALAEVSLTASAELRGRHEKLPPVPRFPQVELDFSVLADASRRYAALRSQLAEFRHPLLADLAFVESYEGRPIPDGKRSIMLRARIGCPDRTLADADVRGFSEAFGAFLGGLQLELRG